MLRAFTMKLLPGCAEEYRKRHDAIWPDLANLLQQSGVREYSIFLDEASLVLFAVMQTNDPALLAALPQHPVMQRWWAYMSDIMETNSDHSPLSTPLQQVFYLP